MILVDTSAWIDLMRNGNAALDRALADGRVLTHSFVLGELACGSLSRDREVRGLLDTLPRVEEATHAEVMLMVQAKRLAGSGIGWIDAHLITSALIAQVDLLTMDRALGRAWERASKLR